MPDSDPRPTLDHLASLARLALEPEERNLFEPQLARILEHARRVVELDTSGVEAESWSGLLLPERPDRPSAPLSRDEATSPASDVDPATGLIRVPRVIGR